MIRILHINSTIYINSGVMSVIMNYYRNIDRQKIQFDFLYFMEIGAGYKTHKQEIEGLGGKVFFIPDFTHLWKFNKQLDKMLDENPEYTIVHIHDPFVVKFIYKTLKKHRIRNIIVHSHATQWSDKKLSAFRNKIICFNLSKYVDYSFACSNAAGKFLYGESGSYTVINNAIDSRKYQFNNDIRLKIREELNINERLVFGHVGNFNNQKNHTFLIDVFRNIVEHNRKAYLLLIGDGPLKQDIEGKVQKLELKNHVLFLGKKSNVENYYQAMDCMILPSLYEGLPMVGVEAQCSGLPVIFSDTITKEVGLVEYNFLSLNASIQKWGQCALQMALSSCDRKMAADIIERKGFSIFKEAKKLANIYIEMNGN